MENKRQRCLALGQRPFHLPHTAPQNSSNVCQSGVPEKLNSDPASHSSGNPTPHRRSISLTREEPLPPPSQPRWPHTAELALNSTVSGLWPAWSPHAEDSPGGQVRLWEKPTCVTQEGLFFPAHARPVPPFQYRALPSQDHILVCLNLMNPADLTLMNP